MTLEERVARLEERQRLIARILARKVSPCGVSGCPHLATKEHEPGLPHALPFAVCDAHATPRAYVEYGSSDWIRGLDEILTGDTEPGDLTRAELDELRRQGDG